MALKLVAVSAAATYGAARYLPSGPLALGYPSDQECDQKVITAAQQGLNVIIWSFITLGADANGNPIVDTSDAPDLDCVANVSSTLKAMGLATTHMISAGGWGAPHPAVTNDPAAVYQSWKDWNENIVARNGFPGFDGIDWDMEGANSPSSPTNAFTVACLDTVGIFSQMAKADGYIVSIVPPESYFDVSTSVFDRSLLHAYSDCETTFTYHGHNAYTYLQSRYGTLPGKSSALTYDFISVQLYESYSHAWCNITGATGRTPQPAADYLAAYIPQLYSGWTVDFSSDPALNWPSQKVSVAQTQLVIGLANGWSDGSRALLIWPAFVGEAYARLSAQGLAPRGFMFWDIGDEGKVPGGYSEPLYLAAGLNAFLHTRS